MTDAELLSYVNLFSKPSRLWSGEEVLFRPTPVPKSAGAYVWYFKQIPPRVPTAGCRQHEGLTLLYVGISPNGPSSGQTLRNRVRSNHFGKNASSSTLRRTLGCLLAEQLGIELRRYLSGKNQKEKFWFTAAGEAALTNWMSKNAFVTWIKITNPWDFETGLIRELEPPLNIEHNSEHPFCDELYEIREEAKKRARTLPEHPP